MATRRSHIFDFVLLCINPLAFFWSDEKLRNVDLRNEFT